MGKILLDTITSRIKKSQWLFTESDMYDLCSTPLLQMIVLGELPARLFPVEFGRDLRLSPPDFIRSGSCRVRDAVYH